MATSILGEPVSRLKPDIVRRWRRRMLLAGVNWRRLIPLAALVVTAFVAIMAGALPYSSVVSFLFPSVSLSCATDQNVTAAMPLPSPLPPPPPHPSRVGPSRLLKSPPNTSAFSVKQHETLVSSSPGVASTWNGSPGVGVIKEERPRGSRRSRSEVVTFSFHLLRFSYVERLLYKLCDLIFFRGHCGRCLQMKLLLTLSLRSRELPSSRMIPISMPPYSGMCRSLEGKVPARVT